ncbi:MAG: SDR family oxidoreductase [Opitutae bacterium]|nr:SDR family oxidoreductase [Opitutae bacterium]
MKNHTFLVTGGTTGIGLATAQLLQADGARVIVTGRNPATLAAARTALGASAVVLASDSASLADAKALGAEVKTHTARLDGAFLNAGLVQFGPVEAMTPQHFDDLFNTNVRGVFFQLQSLLPVLANPSAVVLNASVVADLGLATLSLYSATKAALVSLGQTLAVELAPRGLRLNTVSPGPITTPAVDKLGFTAEAQKGFEDHMAAQTLVKRFGTPLEVARLVRFLLSADSRFIVGANLTVDGGFRLS